MRRSLKFLRLIVPLLIFLISCSVEKQQNTSTPSSDPTQEPRPTSIIVVSLSDGDTLTVNDGKAQHKIRLAGIDAPESNQPFGRQSASHLAQMVMGKAVTLIGQKIDRNGRRVAKVICEGLDTNLEQVKAGYAWHFKTYEKEQSTNDRTAYAEAEIQARSSHLGLWADPNPMPPWDWRKRDEKKNVADVPKGAIIGNKNSLIYHTPGCSTYGKVSPQNQTLFQNEAEAEAAGYRKAKNCG